MERRSIARESPGGVQSSDEALVRAAQRGDRGALDCLLERHYPWLVSLLTHVSSEPELARDVVQEAMFAAAHQLHSLRDAGAFRPWLYRIATNHLHSARRWQRLRHSVSLDELLARVPWRRELTANDVRIDRYGDAAAVHDVLERLSTADRELLLLRYVAGFSGAEVAQIVGISPNAARQRIVRATRSYQRHDNVEQESRP